MARVGPQRHRKIRNVFVRNGIVFMKMLCSVLRVGYRLGVFGNGILGKNAGCKVNDVRRGCTKLHNE